MAFEIFTYGTLMNGRSRNYILRQLQFKMVRPADLLDYKLCHYVDGNYPVALECSGRKISGEAWLSPNVNAETEAAILGLLDSIEGAGTLYRRAKMYDAREHRDIYVYVGIPETWNRAHLVDAVLDDNGLWIGGDV